MEMYFTFRGNACRSFGIIVAVALITIGQLRASMNMCTKYNTNNILPINQGQVLNNYGYHDETFSSIVSCAKRCLSQRKCQSFNFDPSDGWCQLNTENSLSAPAGNMASHPTASHYHAEQWPQELLYECRWHDCPAEAVCMTDHSMHTRYNCTSLECVPVNSCIECYPGVRADSNGRQFRPIGCYKTPGANVVPFLAGSFRKFFVTGADWLDTTVYSRIIRSCADIAGSYELFGMEYYGECWVGNYTHAVFPSNDAGVGSCDTTCFFGMGSTNFMVVYEWL